MNLFKKQITVADLAKHHIDSHQYSTDLEYTYVAQKLQKLIKNNISQRSFGHNFIEKLAEAIKDPNNPYYDEKICHEDGMLLIDDGYCFRSECFHYMIDHGMLSDVRFADNDEERGHRVYQQNIDFIARFMRRADY